MTPEDAVQMCHAPSSSFSAGEWCEAANVLAQTYLQGELRREVDVQLGRHLCYTSRDSRQRFWREVDAALARREARDG